MCPHRNHGILVDFVSKDQTGDDVTGRQYRTVGQTRQQCSSTFRDGLYGARTCVRPTVEMGVQNFYIFLVELQECEHSDFLETQTPSIMSHYSSCVFGFHSTTNEIIVTCDHFVFCITCVRYKYCRRVTENGRGKKPESTLNITVARKILTCVIGPFKRQCPPPI